MNQHPRVYHQGDTAYCPDCSKSWDVHESEIPPCTVKPLADVRTTTDAGRAPLQKLLAFLVGSKAGNPPALAYADDIIRALEMVSIASGIPTTHLSAQRAAAADSLCYVRRPSPEFNPESLQHAGVLCREILDLYYPGSDGVVVTPFKLVPKK